jgi:hypothetical protein
MTVDRNSIALLAGQKLLLSMESRGLAHAASGWNRYRPGKRLSGQIPPMDRL